MALSTGWTHGPIPDTFKTSEIVLAGVLPANSRWLFEVRTPPLRYNERPDLSAAFARLQLIADCKDAKINEGVLFLPYPATPLVEPVRRHNVVYQVTFALENITGDDIVLDMVNVRDRSGTRPPPGLLIYLGGEPGAALWDPGQRHVAPPSLPLVPGGFQALTRFNQALTLRARDITVAGGVAPGSGGGTSGTTGTSSGTTGGAPGSQQVGASVTPSPNGALTSFTTPSAFVPGTTAVYLNGVRQRRGAGNDYVEAAPNHVTFDVAPLATDSLMVDYAETA